MIRRRDFVVGGAALPLLAAAPPLPDNDRLAFRVVRDDSAVGTHVLEFRRQGDGFDVRIAVDIAVRFGPITLFRYTLRGIEQWRNGVVAYAAAAVDDDGTAAEMHCERGPRGLWASGSKAARYLAPTDALPATHWNMAELEAPWISLQDGRLFRPVVAARGEETVKLGDGRTTRARHYVLSGDVQLELWYDDARRWTALRFKAGDGSDIRYELT